MICLLLILLSALAPAPAHKPHATHGIGTAVTMTMYRGGHAATVHP